MTNHGGARPGAGRPSLASQGKQKKKAISITLPSETYDLIMAAKEDGTLSATIAELINEALMNRIGEK